MRTKIKSVFNIFLFLLSIMIFDSCNKNEPVAEIKLDGEFASNEESYSLKGANFYLTFSREENNFTWGCRYYIITDGTYTNEDVLYGWSMNDYIDATYIIIIKIGVPYTRDFISGEFQQHSNWSVWPISTFGIGNLYFKSGTNSTYREYYTDDEYNDFSSISVTGGFEDGETMTLEFNGALKFRHYNGSAWVEEEVSTALSFKGRVNDVRAN